MHSNQCGHHISGGALTAEVAADGVAGDELEDSTELEPGTEDGLDGLDSNKGNPAGPIAFVFIVILLGALIYVLFFLNKRNRI